MSAGTKNSRNPIARNCWKFNKPKVVKSKKLYDRNKFKMGSIKNSY